MHIQYSYLHTLSVHQYCHYNIKRWAMHHRPTSQHRWKMWRIFIFTNSKYQGEMSINIYFYQSRWASKYGERMKDRCRGRERKNMCERKKERQCVWISVCMCWRATECVRVCECKWVRERARESLREWVQDRCTRRLANSEEINKNWVTPWMKVPAILTRYSLWGWLHGHLSTRLHCCDCRYYAILHPMRAKYVCTVGRARRAIFILWVVSLVLAMPIVFQTVSCLPSLLHCRLLVVTFSSVPCHMTCIGYTQSHIPRITNKIPSSLSLECSRFVLMPVIRATIANGGWKGDDAVNWWMTNRHYGLRDMLSGGLGWFSRHSTMAGCRGRPGSGLLLAWWRGRMRFLFNYPPPSSSLSAPGLPADRLTALCLAWPPVWGLSSLLPPSLAPANSLWSRHALACVSRCLCVRVCVRHFLCPWEW